MGKPIDLHFGAPAKAPMPPQDWLRAHTDVSDRAAAGAGWQEGWLAGQAATRGHAPEPLTADEHRFMHLTSDLSNLLARIVGHEPSRPGDLNEATAHIHALQAMVLAQAAARAYPHLYRLLGGTLATPSKINLAQDAQAGTYVEPSEARVDGQG